MTGSVSSIGIGSGLDANTIISQLVSLERQPITQLQTKASSIQTQISAYAKVKSLVSDLRDKSAALASPTLWKQGSATSSDSSVLSASTTGAVSSGDYNVTVQKLAYSQTLYSGTVASGQTFSGSMTLQLMQDYGDPTATPPVAATPKADTEAVTLNFASGTTLEQVRDSINGAGAGITASVVKSADGSSRLALSSKATGTNNQISITGTGDLAAFAYTGPSGSTAMTQGQAAQNAEYTINGIQATSTSNTITNALDGLSLTLNKQSSTPVKVSISNDTDAQLKAMQDFASAYNALNTYLTTQTKYDASTKTAATLQGDSTANNLRSQLRSLYNATNGASTVFANLHAVGFDTSSDGTLTLDATKAKTALQKPDEVRKLFASTDTTVTGNNGLAVRFRELADKLNGTGGLVTTRSDGLQSKLKRNQSDQEKLEARVATTRARLEKQYQALDTQMGKLNSLSTYVTAQMNALSNSSSDS